MKLALLSILTCLAGTPSSSTISASPGTPVICNDDDDACKDRERKRLESLDAEPNLGLSATPESDLPSLGYMFFKMVLTLGAVCLLIYLSLGKLLPKLLRVQAPIASRRILQVVDRLPIDQRRSIMIIKTGEELYYLVGVSENGINLLSRIDPDDMDGALATAAVSEPPRLGRFAQALLGRSNKEE